MSNQQRQERAKLLRTGSKNWERLSILWLSYIPDAMWQYPLAAVPTWIKLKDHSFLSLHSIFQWIYLMSPETLHDIVNTGEEEVRERCLHCFSQELEEGSCVFLFLQSQYSKPPSGMSVSAVSWACTKYHCSIPYNLLNPLTGYIWNFEYTSTQSTF